MPVIIGKVYIGSIEGGIVHFGDAKNISPISNSRSVSGAGEGNSEDMDLSMGIDTSDETDTSDEIDDDS